MHEAKKQIIRIFYGEISAEIFSIIANKQQNEKATEEYILDKAKIHNIICNNDEYIQKLRELTQYTVLNSEIKKIDPSNISNFFSNNLMNGNKNPDKNKKLKKNYIEIYEINKIFFDRLKQFYDKTKETVQEYLKEQAKVFYICEKCQDKISENVYVRSDKICQKCKKGVYKKKDSVDVSQLQSKCEDIFNILDEQFRLIKENRNEGATNYSNNRRYFEDKNGKKIEIMDKITIRETGDELISKTFESVKETSNFMVLVEKFSSYWNNKQKLNNEK